MGSESYVGSVRHTTVEVLKSILRQIGRFYKASSLVGDKPYYEIEDFPWVENIEDNWQAIRRELDALLVHREHLPNFEDISPDQGGMSEDDQWKTFFFYAYGIKAGNDSDRCPRTVEVLSQIPGMKTAFFSIFGPGTHLPPHRGPYNGVLRYHLALKVPEPRDQCGLRVEDEVRHWEEGKSVIFDDTFDHEAWNHTDQDRVVLFVDFVRPMSFPASLLNSVLIRTIGLSPFVLGARGNYTAWEERFERIVNS